MKCFYQGVQPNGIIFPDFQIFSVLSVRKLYKFYFLVCGKTRFYLIKLLENKSKQTRF